MPNATDVFNRRLDRHMVARLRREDAASLKLYRTLERAREELFARLLAFEDRWGDTRTYTPAYLAGIVDDINRTMAILREEATGDLRERMLEGLALGQEQTFAEVSAFYGAGTFTGALAPRVPTEVMLRLLEGRVGLMETTFERLRLRVVQQVVEAGGVSPGAAGGLARATVEEVQQRLAQGVAQGEGTRAIARRLMAPGDGEFVRVGYKEAILQVRLNLNDAFNDGHAAALVDAQATVPELRQRWMSAKVRSTPICLCLHGHVTPVGGVFMCESAFGGHWRGTRPPAIGQAAKPIFHLCRSRIVPDHPDWPENPRLKPLTPKEREYFASGGGLREQDVVRKKVYPGFSPRADAVK